MINVGEIVMKACVSYGMPTEKAERLAAVARFQNKMLPFSEEELNVYLDAFLKPAAESATKE